MIVTLTRDGESIERQPRPLKAGARYELVLRDTVNGVLHLRELGGSAMFYAEEAMIEQRRGADS